MSDPRDPRAESRRGRGTALWVGAVVLAGAATAVLVISDDARVLRLGLVAALWAALIGAFGIAKLRHRAEAREDREAELKRIYELELESEIAARREFELEAELQARRKVSEESDAEVGALREELSHLRQTLEQLVGGDVLFERVALRAESTRVRSLSEQGREQRGAVDSHEQWHDQWGRELPASARRATTTGEWPSPHSTASGSPARTVAESQPSAQRTPAEWPTGQAAQPESASRSDRAHPERARPDRVHSDRAHSNRAHSNRAHSNRAQPAPASQSDSAPSTAAQDWFAEAKTEVVPVVPAEATAPRQQPERGADWDFSQSGVESAGASRPAAPEASAAPRPSSSGASAQARPVSGPNRPTTMPRRPSAEPTRTDQTREPNAPARPQQGYQNSTSGSLTTPPAANHASPGPQLTEGQLTEGQPTAGQDSAGEGTGRDDTPRAAEPAVRSTAVENSESSTPAGENAGGSEQPASSTPDAEEPAGAHEEGSATEDSPAAWTSKVAAGAHAEGTSVSDLLAVYGASDAPRRHRRRAN